MSEGIKISQLQEKSDINGSEYLLAQDGGTNKKISTSKFATKSDIPSDYVTTENLTTELDKKLDVDTYNSDKATFATKEEIPSLDDYVTTENLTTELDKKLDVDTYNSDKATFATKGEIPSLDDYVTTEVADEKYQAKGDYITEIPSDVVRLSESKNIILPVDGSITMIQEVESGSGGVVLCQRNYGEGNVTELGNSRNKLTLNATERPQVDLSGGKKENLAFSSDLETLATKEELGNKVDKDGEKVLSTNDFTNEYKEKLDSINSEDLLTKSEASSTYQTKGDYITSESISSLPEIEEIKTKISGEGVSAIKVVTEIPGEPEPDVLYIVIPKE